MCRVLAQHSSLFYTLLTKCYHNMNIETSFHDGFNYHKSCLSAMLLSLVILVCVSIFLDCAKVPLAHFYSSVYHVYVIEI